MPAYRYIDFYDRFYSRFPGAKGRDLYVKHGDVVEMDHAPDDGRWVPAGAVPATPPAQQAPESPQPVAEPVSQAAPAPAAPVSAAPSPAPSVAAWGNPATSAPVNPNTQPAIVH